MIGNCKNGLFLLISAWVVSRLLLVGHEVLGHAGPAIILGADLKGIGLTWFGGGWVNYDPPKDWSLFHGFIVEVGGFLFQAIVAIASLYFVKKLNPRPFVELVLYAGSAVAVLHGIGYLSFGTFYTFGDGEVLGTALGRFRFLFSFALLLPVSYFSFFFCRQMWSISLDLFEGSYAQKAMTTFAIGGGILLSLLSLAYLESRFFPAQRPPLFPYYVNEVSEYKRQVLGESSPSALVDLTYKWTLMISITASSFVGIFIAHSKFNQSQ